MTTRNICVLFESTGASRDGSASPLREPLLLLMVPPEASATDAQRSSKVYVP